MASLPVSIPTTKPSKLVAPPPLPPPKQLDTSSDGGADLHEWQDNDHDLHTRDDALRKPRKITSEDADSQNMIRTDTAHQSLARRTAEPQTDAQKQDRSSLMDEGYASLAASGQTPSSLAKLIPLEPSNFLPQRSERRDMHDTDVLRKFSRMAPESTYGSLNKALNSPLEFRPSSQGSTFESQNPGSFDGPRRSSGLKAIKTNLPTMSGSPITDSPISSSRFPPMNTKRTSPTGLLSQGIARARENSATAPTDESASVSPDEPSHLPLRNRGSNPPYATMDIDSSMEETGLNLLSLRSQSPAKAAEQALHGFSRKRRAESPPSDDSHPYRTLPPNTQRTSPPQHRSYQSQSSSHASTVRTTSYASNGWSANGRSGSSASSFDTYSNSPISPSDMDLGPNSPYHNPPMTLSPRNQYSHHRNGSDTTVTQQDARLSDASTASGVARNYIAIMCECCPKKPKKFETQEELRLHEAEKQFKCQYCHNRFKNKNEAERHQNSLHLRKHSWSCASLASTEAAFPTSWQKGSVADVCGYCGEEFVSTPPDWNARLQHLINVHKYNECNHQKKFFRADHFRQHLKHSHAGTSGKWTNTLEDACMRDEPLPEPISEE